MSKKMLLLPEPPYLHVVQGDASALTDFGWSLNTRQITRTEALFLPTVQTRFLRGKKMRNLPSLFDEFAAALQFPYYFGDNWNAFWDCITDLSWLSCDSYVLIITDFKQVLMEEPAEVATLIKQLQNAGEEWRAPVENQDVWNRESKGFHVLLQCTNYEKAEVLQRLERLGAEFDEFGIGITSPYSPKTLQSKTQ